MKSEEASLTEKEDIICLLENMQKESKVLLECLWTREEILANKNMVNTANLKIKNMLEQIVKNLYWYQQIGWKKFLPDRETIEKKVAEERILKEKERFLKWLNSFSNLDHFYFLNHRQLDAEKLMKILAAYGYDQIHDSFVLDIGSRDGWWIRKFIEWGARPEKLAGIEFDPQMINHAKNISPAGIQFIEAYPDCLPIPDRKVDIVLMFGILMHVLNKSLRKKIGQELFRVLSDDGILIITNCTKDYIATLDPYFSYHSTGIDREGLMEVFPNSSIHFEKLPRYDLAVIRKNKDMNKNE